MAAGTFNNRQTGARKFEAHPEEVDRDRVGLGAAENRPSQLMRDVDETVDKTRQSDAVDQKPRKTKRLQRRGGGVGEPSARHRVKPEA